MQKHFVAYHRESTIRLDVLSTNMKVVPFFNQVRAARIVTTRACKLLPGLKSKDFDVAEINDFYQRIEKKRLVPSRLNPGEMIEVPVNTPVFEDDTPQQWFWSAK